MAIDFGTAFDGSNLANCGALDSRAVCIHRYPIEALIPNRAATCLTDAPETRIAFTNRARSSAVYRFRMRRLSQRLMHWARWGRCSGYSVVRHLNIHFWF
jgi:hypothetical protein